MADERCSLKSGYHQVASYFRLVCFRSLGFVQLLLVAFVSLSSVACGLNSERRGIPLEVETAIGTVSDDLALERFEKIYQEASDLWRQEQSLEQSAASFKTLNTRLGKLQNRALHSATEQHNSGGPLKGEAFIITYQTKFEKGEGMETFTLIKRDGRWQLARYFVNSTALK